MGRPMRSSTRLLRCHDGGQWYAGRCEWFSPSLTPSCIDPIKMRMSPSHCSGMAGIPIAEYRSITVCGPSRYMANTSATTTV